LRGATGVQPSSASPQRPSTSWTDQSDSIPFPQGPSYYIDLQPSPMGVNDQGVPGHTDFHSSTWTLQPAGSSTFAPFTEGLDCRAAITTADPIKLGPGFRGTYCGHVFRGALRTIVKVDVSVDNGGLITLHRTVIG
jgi:hypothetical protein